MSISFLCTHCGHKLKARREDAGQRVKCTRCATVQIVPQSPDSEQEQSRQPSAAALPVEPAFVPQRRALNDDIDMTPMVDVVFQLLIFFMITAAFALQKGIEIPAPDMPEGSAASAQLDVPESEDDQAVVRVDADGTWWVNDAEAPSEQELLAKLREARRGASAGMRGFRKLLVLAAGDARHASVVTALDAGSAAGMEEVRLALDEEEGP